MEKIKKFFNLLEKSSYISILTGAGISTNSGVPDFRSQDGIYSKYPQDKLFDIDYFLKKPDFLYSFFKDFLPLCSNARPTIMHKVISELSKKYPIKSIITQNIDNLHEDAGSKNVLEIHGSLKKFYCKSCFQRYSFEELKAKLYEGKVPKCKICSNLVRPDIVFFKEEVKKIQKAIDISKKSDLQIIIGTSLTVYPAASLPGYVLRNGGNIIIINRDNTPYGHYASLVFNDDIDIIAEKIKKNI